MSHIPLKWSGSEKKIARAAYDEAVAGGLSRIMTEFKRKAEAAKEPADMWDIEDYLREERQAFDRIFLYSYSRLPEVFAHAIRKGYLDESRLAGLADDKLSEIRYMLSFARR